MTVKDSTNMHYPYYHLDNRVIFKIVGSDFIPLLNRICTINTQDIKAKRVKYGCLLSPQSKFRCDFLLYYTEDETLLCDLHQKLVTTFWNIVSQYKMHSEFTYHETDYVVLCHLHSLEITSQAGEISLPHTAVPDSQKLHANSHDLAHSTYTDPRSTLLPQRIIAKPDTMITHTENKSMLYQDLLIAHQIVDGVWLQPDKSFILEYDFDSINAIDFAKGCYIGQELITRTKHTGIIRKKICKFKLISPDGIIVPINGNDYQMHLVKTDVAQDDIMHKDIKVGHVIAMDSKSENGIGLIRISSVIKSPEAS